MSTESLQNFCQGAVVLFAILVALASFGSNYFGRKAAKDREKQLNSKITELVEGKNELISQNKMLLEQVGEYKSDLEEKEKIITELERKAKKAERGIVSVYSFNGARRQISSGNIIAVAGEEFTAFQQMNNLEKEKKYDELIPLCNKQINKVPEWLTPYLFRAIAFANLGNREKAIADLEHIVENAPDDPEYKQAEELLKQLRQQ